MVTSSSTSFAGHVCHLRFRMVTSSSTNFASPICDVCLRMVTSNSTSFCKPYVSLAFQDAYIKFHEFLQALSVTYVGYIEFHEFLQTMCVTYVSGWLHRVPRVLANLFCDVRFRMVTSSATSSCKPCL